MLKFFQWISLKNVSKILHLQAYKGELLMGIVMNKNKFVYVHC
jgi:hypothetical protein